MNNKHGYHSIYNLKHHVIFYTKHRYRILTGEVWQNIFILFFSIFSINTCYAVTVGDSYGGGTVFCVSQTVDTSKCVIEGSGNYGLIMANENLASVLWCNRKCEIPGARSDDNGKANTDAIITNAIITALSSNGAQSHNDGKTNKANIVVLFSNIAASLSNNAALLCHNYKDKGGNKYWYLPAKNQLGKLYLFALKNKLIGEHCEYNKTHNNVQCFIGNNDYDIYYWTSTEASEYDAWLWCFLYGHGYPLKYNKSIAPFSVRPIREFGPYDDDDIIKLGVTYKFQI